MQKTYRSRRRSGFKRNPSNTQGRKRYYKDTSYSKRGAINHEKYISSPEIAITESIYVEDVEFTDFNLDPIVLRNIKAKNYKNPTKIQSKTIPEIMNGRDVLGMAHTGSGKTAAFLLPMITKIIRKKDEKCLIVAPTRELANQIYSELRNFTLDTKIFGVLVVGGTGYGPQIRLLARNPQFVISTPGRLIDLHKSKRIDLKAFNNIVLDEVDNMLDMGFIRDIEFIISQLSNNRQSLFFSATMNSKVERIAGNILKDPIKIKTGSHNAPLNIEQSVLKYKFLGERVTLLTDLLVSNNSGKFLIFSKTKKGADTLTKTLQAEGHKCEALHGNKSQSQRTRILSQFRKSYFDILIATDVASRGIDVPDITHIINYDEPATYDDYIHRIGRTGRNGKKGTAVTFVR